MQLEKNYTESVDIEHIKRFGQYFTPSEVAHFMCRWAGKNAVNMLDPAVGNSVFLTQMNSLYPDCTLTGYEIDSCILNYFGNPANANLRNEDYLLNDWETQYEAIVCNPPYNRFQAIPNRDEIIDKINLHTGMKYSSYTNLYILFLLKSIHQLSKTGRLAYIIPSEFLNSDYGIPIKKMLLEKHLLRAVINFQNNDEMFFNATTTCCILLMDYVEKEQLLFYNLSNLEQLSEITVTESDANSITVKYDAITAEQKWRSLLNQETDSLFYNLTSVYKFCKITRGIATGANEFFCMRASHITRNGLSPEYFTECICHSTDVKKTFFTHQDFEALAAADKTVYLLDIKTSADDHLLNYLQKGEALGIHQKYLPSCRNPWFSMEQRVPAPIWVCNANRNGLKFVRNLAGVRSLTTFHSIYILEEYTELTNIIFCYFLTPVAQKLLRENRKELGNGLEKFQPGDLKSAKMLDITMICENDIAEINRLYEQLLQSQVLNNGQEAVIIDRLNGLFLNYLTIKTL